MAKNIVNRVDRNLARRLREARRETGLSTRAVAEKLPRRFSISHTTLASYENGATVPPIDILAALADAYSRTLTWFLENREALSHFRYRNLKARAPLSERRQFEALAGKWVDAYFSLRRHLDARERPARKLEAAMESLPPDKLAEHVRHAFLNLEDNEPIQNMVFVLEAFSAWAIELKSSLGIDGAAARHGKEFVVFLNPDVANDRLRMNAGHEIAHILYDDCKQDLGWSDDLVEKRAYLFAASLLMPDSQLEAAFAGRSFLRLIQYREKFGISLASMVYRAEKQRIINTTAARSLWAEMSRRGWKSNEPGYVWRDRAITFETMLESAIKTKALTWLEAETITGIREHELRERIENAMRVNWTKSEEESDPSTVGLPALRLSVAPADGDA